MQKSADPDVFFLLDMNDKGVTSFSSHFARNHRRNVKCTEINLKILFRLLPFSNMKFPQNFLVGARVLTVGAGGEMTEFAQYYNVLLLR